MVLELALLPTMVFPALTRRDTTTLTTLPLPTMANMGPTMKPTMELTMPPMVLIRVLTMVLIRVLTMALLPMAIPWPMDMLHIKLYFVKLFCEVPIY